MQVIVTCGPAYEPIDEVRRITNASTGELGALLCRALLQAGFKVICLRGEGATFAGDWEGVDCRTFTTNEDLLRQLRSLSRRRNVGAVFHAAALCDYRVKAVRNTAGRRLRAAKLASRAGALTLELEPAVKVIGELRRLFPRARIIGWKFELNGARSQALAKGRRQIVGNRTDACVVNGRAYGKGFGVCGAEGEVAHCPTKAALSRWMAAALASGGSFNRAPGRSPSAR
jgi:phosphopantothenate---cysteine ligase (CTP)